MSEIQLNSKQQHAFDLVTQGKNVFITGSAGVGKSMVINHIREWCHCNKKRITVTATTGVAAANVNGITFHAWAGIGLGKSKKEEMSETELDHEIRKRAYYLRRNETAVKRYTDTDILVIDEVSMLDFSFVKKVNAIAKIIRKCSKPFGGIQLVLTGDFYQLGPVQKELKKTKFVFEDYCWDEMIQECVHLTEVYRQKSSDFVTMLHRLRVGDVDDEIVKKLQDTEKNKLTNDNGIIPTVLFCKKVDVELVNIRGLNKIDGKEHTFKAIDKFINDEAKELYRGSFTYPTTLTLKVGAQVMLIKNLDLENKLVNGSRGVVVSITEDDPIDCPGGSVLVRFADDTEYIIKPDSQQFTEDIVHGKELTDYESCYKEPIVLASRLQFPLRLAYALTVHKSQGLSIDYLHVDLRGAFCPGQAYVALSRATSFETLRVTNFTKKCIITSDKVKDFYKRIDEGVSTKRQREDRIETYFSKKSRRRSN